jgi:tripartite-type tricarboxylate transporter receptor subunit TctC
MRHGTALWAENTAQQTGAACVAGAAGSAACDGVAGRAPLPQLAPAANIPAKGRRHDPLQPEVKIREETMRTRTMPSLLTAIAVGAAFALMPKAANAEFPERPVKLVVPFGAGGATHTLARLFAEQLEKALKQSVPVTAVPGSGGAIGSAQVARAKPDGYTLLMGSNGTNGQRWQVSEAGYTLDSFRPLGAIASLPTAWVVKTSSPIKSMKELTEHIKKNPGVKYASVGTGSSLHIAAERWAVGEKLDIVHIAAKGGKDAIVKLLSGEVAFVVVAAHNLPSQKKGKEEGQLRGLAVSSPQSYPYAADLPTLKSLGVNFTDVTWWGPMAPKGVPDAAFKKLAGGVKQAAQTPAFLDVLKRFYFVASYMSAEEAWADLQEFSRDAEPILKKIGMHKDLGKKS